MDPTFSIIYGDLKAGKTADMIAAFPGAAFIAAPGALAPAESVWGLPALVRRDLQTFTDVRKWAESLPEGIPICMDDATLIADRTAIAFEEAGKSGWDIWDCVLRSAIRLRDVLRRKQSHAVLTCHARGAHMENGVRVRGGPSFQGQCSHKLPAAADLLLRAEIRPGAGGTAGTSLDAVQQKGPKVRGWPMVYRTAYHPDWIQGSRHNTPDMVPMNLGEILRLAGFSIPRLRGLEWQESLANALANRILEVGLADEAKVTEAILRVREAGTTRFKGRIEHVDWAIRDGHDRAILRLAKNAQRAAIWGI